MRNQLTTAIYNKLNSITGLVGNVYKFNKGGFDKYPVAVILGSDCDREKDSVKTIKKTYKFKVKILQEVNEEARGQEAGESLLINLADLIDDAFENDDTLGGICDDVSLTSVFMWEDRELLMRGVDLQIDCRKLKQIS